VAPKGKLLLRLSRDKISVESARGDHSESLDEQSLGHLTIQRFEAWAREIEPRLRDQADYELLGRHLYEFLFRGKIERALDDEYSRADETKTVLRLELFVDPSAGTLAAVPWEFLYFQPPDKKRGFFMATSSGLALIRTDSSTRDPSSVRLTERPRILVIASCPPGFDYVVSRPVAEGIATQLAARVPGAELRTVFDPPDLDAVKAALAWRPHIVQFIGHGQQPGTEGQLAMLHSAAPWVTGRELLDQLPDDARPRLVVLHACYGAAIAASTLAPKLGFGAIAPMLLADDIPAVIAMQYGIDQQSAIDFTAKLYSDLLDGLAIHRAVQSARALLTRPQAIPSGAPEGTTPLPRPARAFGTPVLYMSGTDGVLFPRAEGALDTRNQIEREPSAEHAGDASVKPVTAPFTTAGPGTAGAGA